MFNGEYVPIPSFAGGQVSNTHATKLGLNQFVTMNNWVILPGGSLRQLYPSKEIFTTTASAVQGISSLILSDGSASYVVAVAGGKFWIQGAGVPMTDKTGSVTITGGYNYLWSFATFDDQVIAFGGLKTAPDAPFKWTGTGNASALGGSPPSAYGCFSANNRMFAFRTAADPSTVYWSIIGNAEDWTGSGSGSAVAGSLSDGSSLTAAAVLNSNTVLLFKDTATYQMIITEAPFPVFTMFDTVGCVGKNAVVNVDGEVYWINQYGRMVSTDGESLKNYPDSIDDKWDSVVRALYFDICGMRVKRADHDWIVWSVTTGAGANDAALIWDLKNKCWITSITNCQFVANCAHYVNGSTYFGSYSSSIYEADVVSGTGSVTSVLASGQINTQALEKITQVSRFALVFKPNGGATIAPTYGYDLESVTTNTITLPNASTTGTSYWTEGRVVGRGNHFQYQISYTTATAAQRLQIYKIELGGKVSGQKTFTAD